MFSNYSFFLDAPKSKPLALLGETPDARSPLASPLLAKREASACHRMPEREFIFRRRAVGRRPQDRIPLKRLDSESLKAPLFKEGWGNLRL